MAAKVLKGCIKKKEQNNSYVPVLFIEVGNGRDDGKRGHEEGRCLPSFPYTPKVAKSQHTLRKINVLFISMQLPKDRDIF